MAYVRTYIVRTTYVRMHVRKCLCRVHREFVDIKYYILCGIGQSLSSFIFRSIRNQFWDWMIQASVVICLFNTIHQALIVHINNLKSTRNLCMVSMYVVRMRMDVEHRSVHTHSLRCAYLCMDRWTYAVLKIWEFYPFRVCWPVRKWWRLLPLLLKRVDWIMTISIWLTFVHNSFIDLIWF